MRTITRLAMVLAAVAGGLATTGPPAAAGVSPPGTRTVCVGATPHSWGDRPGGPDPGVSCFEIEQPTRAPVTTASYLVLFESTAADTRRATVIREAMAD